ncbi:MAG TPA: hypothetical protein G4O18_06055 [Dehalococcoidia bacterium]|nr:hypothetical protein [Dehalococcoidia bacterium]
MPRLQGTAMKELVEGGKLKRADILLSRTKRSLLGFLIRFGTNSYWNHAFMIYVLRSPEQGYNTTFIIESGGAGIDIHNISHYFERPDKYDVAVKRYEADWFQDDVGQGGSRYQRKVRGFALSEIDDKYDHKLIITIARRFIRQVILGFMFPLQRRKKDPSQRKVMVQKVAGFNVNAYICSGFVQWAYYNGVGQALKEDNLDDSRLQEVIFNPRFPSPDLTPENGLLATTPADLANSDKLSWKYIIKGGKVWEVAAKEEVDTILSSS